MKEFKENLKEELAKDKEFMWEFVQELNEENAKLIKVLNLAKDVCATWDRFASTDERVKGAVGSCYDPRFKDINGDSLIEAIEELEKYK